MARTEMNQITRERLTGKLGVWYGAQARGGDAGKLAAAKIDVLYWALEVLGFVPDILEQLETVAMADAGVELDESGTPVAPSQDRPLTVVVPVAPSKDKTK